MSLRDEANNHKSPRYKCKKPALRLVSLIWCPDTVVETNGGDAEFDMDGFTEQGEFLYGLRQVEASPGNWKLYGLGTLSDTAKTLTDSLSARYMMSIIENQPLLQRLGDLRHSPDDYGVWVKLQCGDIKGKSGQFINGFNLDYDGVQLGIDKKFSPERLNGSVYLGL